MLALSLQSTNRPARANLGRARERLPPGYRRVLFDAFLEAFFANFVGDFFEADRAVLFPIGFADERGVRRMGCKSQGSGAASSRDCFSDCPEVFSAAACFNLRMSAACPSAIVLK